jgi:hypothetical protein
VCSILRIVLTPIQKTIELFQITDEINNSPGTKSVPPRSWLTAERESGKDGAVIFGNSAIINVHDFREKTVDSFDHPLMDGEII